MEDLASSIMSLPHRRHSAPLYLFFDEDDGGFEFAAAAGAKNVVDDDSSAAPRSCTSDVSAYADELFRGSALLPLKLPPRLQQPAWSAASSAATSPNARLGKTRSWSPFASRRRQRCFDPFAAALEKVRRDCTAPAPRRARSLPPLRGAAAAYTGLNSSHTAGTAAAAQKESVRTVRASAVEAPRALRTRRRGHSGAPCRSGLLVCFGF